MCDFTISTGTLIELCFPPYVAVAAQLRSRVRLFAAALTAARHGLSSTVSWSLLKFMSIESVVLSVTSSPLISPFGFNLLQHQGFLPDKSALSTFL